MLFILLLHAFATYVKEYFAIEEIVWRFFFILLLINLYLPLNNDSTFLLILKFLFYFIVYFFWLASILNSNLN